MKDWLHRGYGYMSSPFVAPLRTLMGRFGTKGNSGKVIAIVSLVRGRGQVM